MKDKVFNNTMYAAVESRELFKEAISPVPGFPESDSEVRDMAYSLKGVLQAITEKDMAKTLLGFCRLQQSLCKAVLALGLHNVFDEAYDILHILSSHRICENEEELKQTVAMYVDQGLEITSERCEVGTGDEVLVYWVIKDKATGEVLPPRGWEEKYGDDATKSFMQELLDCYIKFENGPELNRQETSSDPDMQE